jgi:hypothetical protein
MKTITFQGVPFSVSESSVYIYGTTTLIGSHDGVNLILNDGWESSETVTTSLAEYRNKLKVDTMNALAKAAELQKQ